MTTLFVAWFDIMPVSINFLIAYYGGPSINSVLSPNFVVRASRIRDFYYSCCKSRPIWRANSSRQHKSDIKSSRYIAKEHSYDNVARLLGLFSTERQSRRLSGKLHSVLYTPNVMAPLLPNFNSPLSK